MEAGWNKGDFTLVDECYSPNYMIHDPAAPDFPGGREPFKAFVSGFRTGLPDLKFTVNETVAEGDKVAWRFTVDGTHLGTLMGIPPTGKRSVNTGIVISRFDEKGMWVEDYVNWDTLGMLRALGVIPTPGQEPAATGR